MDPGGVSSGDRGGGGGGMGPSSAFGDAAPSSAFAASAVDVPVSRGGPSTAERVELAHPQRPQAATSADRQSHGAVSRARGSRIEHSLPDTGRMITSLLENGHRAERTFAASTSSSSELGALRESQETGSPCAWWRVPSSGLQSAAVAGAATVRSGTSGGCDKCVVESRPTTGERTRAFGPCVE